LATKRMEHTLSIEIKSKKHVRHISMSDVSHEHVLFEGCLGELEELSMTEGAVLEVRGSKGALRIDLSEDELRKMLSDRSIAYPAKRQR